MAEGATGRAPSPRFCTSREKRWLTRIISRKSLVSQHSSNTKQARSRRTGSPLFVFDYTGHYVVYKCLLLCVASPPFSARTAGTTQGQGHFLLGKGQIMSTPTPAVLSFRPSEKNAVIPDQLVKRLAGTTLIQRALDTAKQVEKGKDIWVVTDSDEIRP